MSVRLEDFSLFTESEKQELLSGQHDNKVDLPVHRTIVELFEEQANKSPAAPAWECGGRRMTYEELNASANQLAGYLRQQYNIGLGDHVGLYMKRSGDLIVALLAILKTGAAYVPIDPEYPAERIEYILGDASIAVCIAGEDTTALLQALNAGSCTVLNYAHAAPQLAAYSAANSAPAAKPGDLLYIMYTSGSTGNPKGVAIEHRNLVNYICWANQYYFQQAAGYPFALFTSVAFDLTCTCIYSTLLRGDCIVIFEEKEVSELLVQIFSGDFGVRAVKLTPSHISMLNYLPVATTKVCCAIVGGEALTEGQVRVLKRLNPAMHVYNEYGPTEATVGCMIEDVSNVSGLVTIGKPIYNTGIYIMDANLQLMPAGVVGELCISGAGLARGYINQPNLTGEKFCPNPYEPGGRLYRSGDLARRLPDGRIELLGRKDTQVKLRGYRIELEEIETVLTAHPDIVACTADIRQLSDHHKAHQLKHCTVCGIASNYPGIAFDAEGVCSMCRDYEKYRDKAQRYFKSIAQLKEDFESVKASGTGDYDCLMLYSGGKDSTYVLCKLVKEFNLKVLAFSFDNGYISEQAKANIVRVTKALQVDHVFGSTPRMNEIFVDSLMRHSNVCEGCFKTIYTLGISLAKEKNIHCVVTGLSQGQLYETRLYQLFGSDMFDSEEIDKRIIEARKAYHSMDDAVSRCLDTSLFANGTIFEQVRIVDYFRYAQVELKEMYDYLDKHVPWVRPSDTGRSTNCRINDLGIYVHKKQKGYHNYALPYSWDVRMGHKTRHEAMDELDDDINEAAVKTMMQEIGYHEYYQSREASERYLVAYYVAAREMSEQELRDLVQKKLPAYMMPTYFVRLSDLPLTTNGKINRQLLPGIDAIRRKETENNYVPPSDEMEDAVANEWKEVLKLEKVGVNNNFFTLGGSSIKIVMLYERIEKKYPKLLKVNDLFDNATIAAQAGLLRKRIAKDETIDAPGFEVIEL